MYRAIISLVVCLLIGFLLYGLHSQNVGVEPPKVSALTTEENGINVSFDLEEPAVNVSESKSETFVQNDGYIFLIGLGIIVVFFLFAMFSVYEASKRRDLKE